MIVNLPFFRPVFHYIDSMKYLLIISCLLFTSLGWSKTINSDDLVKKEGLYYEKSIDVPFTGNVTGQQQGKISKGKREGEWIWFYENGLFRYKWNYKYGKEEGEWKMYYESGELWKKGNYKEGNKDGEQLSYWENGQLGIKGNYKDGRKDGEQLHYNENGQLESKWNYKDGKKAVSYTHLTLPTILRV